MTSSLFSKLAQFLEHDVDYQPSKFQCSRMSQSNFMEGVGTHPSPPPPVLQRNNYKNSADSVKSGLKLV